MNGLWRLPNVSVEGRGKDTVEAALNLQPQNMNSVRLSDWNSLPFAPAPPLQWGSDAPQKDY
jgi:hypothetical protein